MTRGAFCQFREAETPGGRNLVRLSYQLELHSGGVCGSFFAPKNRMTSPANIRVAPMSVEAEGGW